ncbi:PREDICTED: glycerophosphodiester phosphodiesterase 1-like [Priapulus caudatus]|uniref:Glycerophosphodiester phosphodiesterase 1-like n=1 Tax=Priapulus caudatus TaxID=37621 RepID=A0ABM1EHZ6_PRICU|nr:PREDICTED: glycerophosphodiester phosphodiesterase 1-like [Priapulus caudatus]
MATINRVDRSICILMKIFVLLFCIFATFSSLTWSMYTGLCVILIIYAIAALLYIPRPNVELVKSALAHNTENTNTESTTPNNISETTKRKNKVLVIAHRGAGDDAPENTLVAFRLAKKNGADAIEFDLSFSKDDVPIVIHDDTVDRTTDGTGNISDLSLAELRRLNAAAKFKQAVFPHETIPTLDEALQECLHLGLKMFIDVKEYDSRVFPVIQKAFRDYPKLYDQAMVCSFYPNVVYKVRKADPRIMTGLTWRPHFMSREGVYGRMRHVSMAMQLLARAGDVILEWLHENVLWYLCGNSVFLIHGMCVSDRCKRLWEERGIHLVVWTVNDDIEKHFLHDCLQLHYMTDSLVATDTEVEGNTGDVGGAADCKEK